MPKVAGLPMNVMETIAAVTDKLEDSCFKIEESDEFSKAVEYLNEYFDTDERTTWMLCAMLALQLENEDGSFMFRGLARFFDCSMVKVLTYKPEIESLLAKRYIYNSDDPEYLEIDLNDSFKCSDDLLNALFHNEKPVIAVYVPKKKDVFDMLKEIGSRMGRFRRLGMQEVMVDTKEKKYADEPFVIAVNTVLPGRDNAQNRLFFYSCCSDFLQGDSTDLNERLQQLYSTSEKFSAAREFMNENHILFKTGLIAFDTKGTLTDATIEITQKAKEMLLGENLDLFTKMGQGAGMIQPDAIVAKELFYEQKNEAEIVRLTACLQEENLCQIQARLSKKGLPKGIAVLLYGAPGTGKTETVYQLAKATGRMIFHVDISQAKSCWFGDSEKKIKKIFTDYKQLCRASRKNKEEKLPILLFNEADAIFSKRKDSNSSNVAQTENAMQNIILEEMEKMDGILIATTNLADNLDTAFERRFLFKIKFENPSVEAKRKIWKSKLTYFDEHELTSFAENYDLSGGQIDNIVRKVMMDEVITGVLPTAETLHELCKHEKIGNDGSHKIGFCC